MVVERCVIQVAQRPRLGSFDRRYVGVGETGYGSLAVLRRRLAEETLLTGGKGRNLGRFQAAIVAKGSCASVLTGDGLRCKWRGSLLVKKSVVGAMGLDRRSRLSTGGLLAFTECR